VIDHTPRFVFGIGIVLDWGFGKAYFTCVCEIESFSVKNFEGQENREDTRREGNIDVCVWIKIG
jgi:hypothetical protein